MSETIRVVVVDDHVVSRRGIISFLAADEQIEVVAEGCAGEHVLELLGRHHPDVLITDLQMPAQAEGNPKILFEPVATLQKAVCEYPSTSIIVISQEHSVQTIQSMAEIGVKGYMLKTDDMARLLGHVVISTQKGMMYFSPDVQEIIHTSPKIEQKRDLTKRELEVIRAVLRSPDVERVDLAPTMGIAPSTLHKHIHSLYEKMEVSNMVACVLKAMRMGLVDDPFQQ